MLFYRGDMLVYVVYKTIKARQGLLVFYIDVGFFTYRLIFRGIKETAIISFVHSY